MEWTEASQCMLKPREFVPWGLPGPTRGRRDAAAFKLASKTKPPSQGPGTQAARMEGPSRGGPGGPARGRARPVTIYSCAMSAIGNSNF